MNTITLITLIFTVTILAVITGVTSSTTNNNNNNGLLIVDNVQTISNPKLRIEALGKRAFISPLILLSSNNNKPHNHHLIANNNNITTITTSNGQYSNRMRGVSANCAYDNSQQDVKKFKCSFEISKKILSQNLYGKAETILSINLNQHTANIIMKANNEMIYQHTFTLGDLIPPICADIFYKVGLCLRINNVHFHSQSPQCFKLNLQVYLQALTFEEVILSEPVGFNPNLC
ncbi:predicted protein [Naegleria gruberi]|uniref:Predicted protein n=1 Tax=Naegleria gruberi TaxID=5762 RepID=D2VT91_NAEGR|nr:uncharacterized protein NAEGRDRAFT_72217 [Naegleria gruberi]EFC39890.1 predicted protein [Naegleria gruberi]|eukprot:XP_002672634.1 predicted protein [Naegleria gruberi strain NEG-M]